MLQRAVAIVSPESTDFYQVEYQLALNLLVLEDY